jgi:hypothetical protein
MLQKHRLILLCLNKTAVSWLSPLVYTRGFFHFLAGMAELEDAAFKGSEVITAVPKEQNNSMQVRALLSSLKCGRRFWFSRRPKLQELPTSPTFYGSLERQAIFIHILKPAKWNKTNNLPPLNLLANKE